jgi:hypothetical protein
MKLDMTAAAYGLIQVVFADVTNRLAQAVFVLQKRRDANITFERIFCAEFTRILRSFKIELKQLDQAHIVEADDVETLREICPELATLAVWRNDRIHARIEPVSDGLALYEWRTGKRLSISYEECTEIIERLTKVIVTLEAYLPPVLRSVDLEKEIDAFFDQLEQEQEGTVEP